MPFPPQKGIKAPNLAPAQPTPFDANALKQQLENIGLSCAQINQQNLTRYIQEVSVQLPMGAVQSFAIKAPANDLQPVPARTAGQMVALAEAVPTLQDSATGNWTINAGGDGYGPNLEVIQYPDHFNWLYQNRATNGFTGVIDNPPPYTGDYPNAEAIQNLFVNVGTVASATLVKGIDQDSLKATLSNAIQPLANADLSDYNVSDSRVIFLVDNFNPSTGYADGLGVLFINWSLQISDYKRKSKDGGDTHPTTLTIKCGSVLYSDPGPLCSDYFAVLKQFSIDPNTAPTCAV